MVDDDQDIRNIYQRFLTKAGYEVDLASDGQEGLTKILQGGYNLILLDIMMPKIDGLSILRKLQTMPQPTHYNGPTIMLSVLDKDYFVNEALSLGAKGYLPKAGLTPQMALSKISEILKDSSNLHTQ